MLSAFPLEKGAGFLWLLADGLSILVVLGCFCCLLSRRASVQPLVAILNAGLLLMLVGCFFSDGRGLTRDLWPGLLQLGLALLFLGAGLVVPRLGSRSADGIGSSPVPLLILGTLLSTWLSWRVADSPLFGKDTFLASDAGVEFKSRRFPAGCIETAPADARYNCHDWTFFGGPNHYFLKGTVEGILEQRGYQPVDQPALGDVVIYRCGSGAITHSGVVRALGTDDFVLIESKWGSLGRYLHEPNVNGYPYQRGYYRAPEGPKGLAVHDTE